MRSIFVGIAGGSASGKTVVADKVYEKVANCESLSLIRMDDYYKCLDHLSYEERAKVNFDHPDSIDFELLKKHIKDLKSGKSIEKPLYDFTIHNRRKETEHLEPTEVIILEGILTFVDPEIRDLCDIKIFVDTPDDIRFIRRLKRDVNERARSVDTTINQYLKTVRPMHHQFVEPTKQYADIIVPNGGKNPIVIDIIANKIASIIGK